MNILESFYSNIKNNLSVESFNGYKYDLKCLIRFLCEREGMDANDTDCERIILQANEADLYAFIVYARENLHNGVDALNRKISSVRKLYDFLYENNYIKKNVARNIRKFITVKDSSRNILSMQECQYLIKNINGRNATRDRLIVMMFLYYSVNVNDLLHLKTEDISENSITFGSYCDNRKTYKKNDALKSILNDFFSSCHIPGSSNVFTTSTGKPLSRRSIQHITAKRLNEAGIYVNGDTTQLLRRTGLKIFSTGQKGSADKFVLA